MSYTCPRCGMTSHNLSGEKNQHCDNCHAHPEPWLKYRDARVTMDYIVLGYLRTLALMNHLELTPRPSDDPDDYTFGNPDEYTLTIAADHPAWRSTD